MSLQNRPVEVIPLAPFDQYQLKAGQAILRDASPDRLNILYFGLIRLYKGVEDLVAAFDLIPGSDDALIEAGRMQGKKYMTSYTWEIARQKYGQLFDEIEKHSVLKV